MLYCMNIYHQDNNNWPLSVNLRSPFQLSHITHYFDSVAKLIQIK